MQIRLEQILICRYKRKMAAIQPHKYKIIMISGGLIRIDEQGIGNKGIHTLAYIGRNE